MTKPWADQPYKFMPVPGHHGAPTSSDPAIHYMAEDMANVHNAILRGLNAIYLQCPHVHAEGDIADFAFFIKAWADSVHHHHHSEEVTLFPGFDQIAKEAGAIGSVMNANVEQHHLFEPGLVKLIGFADAVREGKREYDWKELKGIIDGFAPALTEHLHDEIQTLLGLEKFDGTKLKKVYDEVVAAAVKTADPNVVIPFMFGCIDKTQAGAENFPPTPFFVPWLNAWWFSRKHQGSWRFCPCDSWRQPRPLQFLGKDQ